MRSRAILRATLVLFAIGEAALVSSNASASDYYYRRGTFALGGGFNTPVGETNPYLNSSGTIFFAGGRNINRRTALQVEYTHNWMAVDHDVLARAATDSTQLDNAHASLWSITLNGIYRFDRDKDFVPWLTAGGGYYKRNILLTQNALVYIPPILDPWWGWIDGGWVPGEAIIGQHTSAGFGLNFGAGVDFGIEGGATLFFDARYHYAFMDGINMQIIPVMAGFRW